MSNRFFKAIIYSIVIFTSAGASALNPPDTSSIYKKDTCCPQEDLIDLFFKGNNPFRTKKPHRFRAFGVPIIAFDPATSLQLGVGGSFSLQLGNPADTKISAGMTSVLFTLDHQFFVQYKSNVFFPHNTWLLQSDWRYYLFNLPTYSLGTQDQTEIPSVPGIKTVIVDPALNGTYAMDYDWLRFHNVLSHKVTKNIYCGIGYQFDYHFDINDYNLHIRKDTLFNTPNYSYSILHGYNPNHYITSGLSANFVFDNRDDMVNAYHGIYINVNYQDNFTWLGSSRNGSELWTEFRTYIPLSRRCPRHLLAFWYYGTFVTSGSIPYMDLMSISYDQMNSSGRGYAQGRYRGEDFVYGEMEYRFPISQRTHILGGVLFTNVSTVSNRDMNIPLFGYFQPAAGAGIRIMAGKNDRTNIAIDFGIGHKSDGLYLQTQEVF